MSSKAQKQSGYLLPDIIEGHPLICAQLKIPDDPMYIAAFLGALNTLGQWYSWEKSYTVGDVRATNAAQYWRKLINDYLTFDNNCGENYVDCTPIGTVVMWFGSSIPDGWLPLNGGTYNVEDYPELAAILPAELVTEFTFQVPDMSGQAPIGVNPGPSTGVVEVGLNEFVGETEVTLTQNQLPVTRARVSAYQEAANSSLPGSTRALSTAAANIYRTTPTEAQKVLTESRAEFGGGFAHNNVQPSRGVWFIIKADPCPPEDNTVTRFRLRQNPEYDCHLQQSFDDGLTWSLAFDFSKCKQEEPAGINLTLQNQYEQIINQVQDDYDGTPGSIAPELLNNDDERDAAICYALRLIVYAVLDAAADERERSEDLGIMFGALVGIAGLAFGLLTAGTSTLIIGAAAAAIAGGAYAAIKATTEEELRDTAARESVICCAYNALAGSAPSYADFQNAFDACGFTAGSTEAKQAEIMSEVFQTLDMYLAFLKTANEGYALAEKGLIEPCENCATPCEFQDFKTGMGAWTLNTGTQNTQGVKSIWQTNTAAQTTLNLGVDVTFTKVRARVFIPRQDDAQFFQIAKLDGATVTVLRVWDTQTIGWHTFEWSGSSVGDAIRLTATPTQVLSNDAIIEWAEVCYI